MSQEPGPGPMRRCALSLGSALNALSPPSARPNRVRGRFTAFATDGNGKQRHTYTDVRGAITSVKELNGTSQIWTSYTYDPMGQVTAITDDKNSVTRAAYDGLGRRTVFDSPDAGRAETRYDLAGNVTAKITANLRAAGRTIEYDYDYSRLKAVRYPSFPANDVTYSYGAPGAADNAASRITEVRAAAGTTTRGYGPLGELTRETRAISAVDGAPRTYATAWRYDSFGVGASFLLTQETYSCSNCGG